MLLLAGTTDKSQQGRHFQTARTLSLWPFSPFDYSKMEDGQTGQGNPECEYYSPWMEDSDVDSEESPRAEGMPAKPKTAATAALYPQVPLSLGDDSEVHKRKRPESTSEGQKKKSRRRMAALPTPRLRRLSHLLQMSDMLALREHLSPVKEQEHTVRNYSTPWSPKLTMWTILQSGRTVQKKTSATKKPSQGSQAICPT